MVQQSLLLGVGVVGLLLFITLISYATNRWIGNDSDYILAGREVSSSLLATGVLAFGFATDISVLFAIFGLVYGYFPAVSLGIVYFAWIVYGLILVKMVRNVGTSTITEWFEMRFGYPTRAAVSVVQLLSIIFIISAGTLGAASILNGYGGWPILPTVVALLFAVALIALFGGLWGVTVSNVVLTVYGLIVFPAVLVYLYFSVGDFSWLMSSVPTEVVGFAFPGGWDFTSFGATSYLTWTVLWFVALVYGATYYWTRAGSARSDKVARNGYIGAGILGLFLMTFVMPLLAMYALALAPDVFTITGGEVPPAGAFGVLAGGLPVAIGVLVPIGFVAASVSTYTTDVVAGAALGLRDFYQRFFAPEAEPEDLVLPSRIISVIVLVIAFLLTIVLDVQGLVELFLATLGIASVIVLVDLHWKVMTARSSAVAVVVGIITVFGWTLGGVNQATGIHVVWPTLGVTLGIGILGGFVTEQKYYMQNDWSVVPTAEEVEAANDIDLTNDHLAVLESIATGGKRFADFLDTLQIATHQVNEIVEELDRNRYIHRKGKRSHEFYKFELTNKGRESFEEADIGAEKEGLREHDLNEDLYEVLGLINERSGIIIDDIAEERNVPTSNVVPLVQRLLEQEYISGYGQIRQKLETTERGETVLQSVDLSGSATDQAE